jgi:hypothetical protein
MNPTKSDSIGCPITAWSGRVTSLPNTIEFGVLEVDLWTDERYAMKGQPVWTYEPARKVGICSKLTSPWKGPFIIEKQIDDVTFLFSMHLSCE